MAAKFPQKFGNYILLRKIAMGGMAEIFRGKSVGAEGFEKDLVIKRILPHYTEDEEFVKMFIDEASIAAKLQHSNIVQIFDFNVVDGSYFIAMEYVEGKDLKNLIDATQKEDKPLTPAQCVWIIMELSKGLHHAHIKSYKGKPLNIVHRDISPQNAMISFNGEIKLMDFGIAKAASRSTKTVAGTVKGKCAYMSPEQARGKPLDGRSDLFSLAVVLWEMLTHKRLFLGNSDFVTLSNVLKQDAPAPSSMNPDVPEALDAIVLRALAKDRDERQANVEQFARDLTKWFYATVDDLDSVAIGPTMKDLFKDDIEQLAQWGQEENDMLVAAHSEASNSKEVPAVANEDATVAIQAADFDPQSAKTLMEGNLTAEKVRAALAEQQSAESTVALDTSAILNTATGTAAAAGTGTHASGGGSKMWIIAALLVLIGGSVGAFLALGPKGNADEAASSPSNDSVSQSTGQEETKGPEPVLPETLHVEIVPDPADAQVYAKGKALKRDASGSFSFEGPAGSTLAVKIKTKSGQEKSFTIRLDPDKLVHNLSVKAEAITAELRIQVSPAGSTVTVDLERAKKGNGDFFVFQGVMGQEVRVQVTSPSNKKGAVVKVTLSKELQIIEASAGPADPTVRVACDPSDALVTATRGTAKTQDGIAMVSGDGLRVGLKLTVTCTKKGYKPAHSKSHTLKAGLNDFGVLKMSKVGETPKPRGFGTVILNSVPWARCTLAGKSKVTKGTWHKVPAGRQTAVCYFKGDKGQKKRVSVHVRPNTSTTKLFRP